MRARPLSFCFPLVHFRRNKKNCTVLFLKKIKYVLYVVVDNDEIGAVAANSSSPNSIDRRGGRRAGSRARWQPACPIGHKRSVPVTWRFFLS